MLSFCYNHFLELVFERDIAHKWSSFFGCQIDLWWSDKCFLLERDSNWATSLFKDTNVVLQKNNKDIFDFLLLKVL